MSGDVLEVKLRAAGFSVTKTRQAVFNALRDHDNVTIRQLVDALRGVANRASVYRTVDLFESLDIVHRIYNGWKYTLELSGDILHHHHHMTCVRCGKTISVEEDAELTSFIEKMSRRHSFTVTNHQFELTGLCELCASKA